MEQNWSERTFEISGLKLLTPFYREDVRGYFLKYYEAGVFVQLGIKDSIDETFETWSKKTVIRGLHFQTQKPQAKLVRTVFGEIYDVAVDLRKKSSTFGHYQAVYLNSKANEIFYIPAGFAHGFQVVSEYALVSYQCIGQYLREFDTGIHYKDPELKIPWPLEECLVSEKDEALMSFAGFRKCVSALEDTGNEDEG